MLNPDMLDTAAALPLDRAPHPRDALDTTAARALVRLAESAARLTGFPLAQVNLIDGRSQCTVAMTGGGLPALLPKDSSFCQLVSVRADALVVHDAALHPRWLGHPAHTELGVGSYVGVPVPVPDLPGGVVLCVFSKDATTVVGEDALLRLEVLAGVVAEVLRDAA